MGHVADHHPCHPVVMAGAAGTALVSSQACALRVGRDEFGTVRLLKDSSHLELVRMSAAFEIGNLAFLATVQVAPFTE